jgi:hypothetical protein
MSLPGTVDVGKTRKKKMPWRAMFFWEVCIVVFMAALGHMPTKDVWN